MESLSKLRESLSKSLILNRKSIDKINEFTEKTNNIIKIIENMLNNIENGNYTALEKNIDDFLEFRENIKQDTIEFDKIKEAIKIINTPDKYGILKPQKIEAEKLIKNHFLLVLNKLLSNLNMTNYENTRKKKTYEAICEKYIIYLDSFNTDGVIKAIEKHLVEEFFSYVNDCGLEPQEVFEITREFGKFNLKHSSQKYNRQMSKIKLETSRNAKIVLEEIIEEKKIDEIVIPGIATIEKTTEQKEEVILTEEERKIYNIIMEIISEKSEKLNNSDIEILNILSKDDYSLRLRKNIYSINKFNLICYDLKNNLLDKMTMDNKKEIFEVFTYVIDLYGKSQQEEYISIIEDFTESEKKVISSIYDTYITEFSNMSESEKEQIDTYDVELNLDLEVSELYTNLFGRNSDIPPKIIYYLLLKKFQKVYTEYRYDKENEYELLNISDTEEEFKRIFKEKQNIIRKLIKKITEYNFYNKAEEEIENTPIEEAELFDVKNGIIFLEIDDLEKDRQNVLKNGMDSLKAVNRTLRKIMTKSIVDLRMSHNKKVKTGKKDKDIVSYDDEFTLRRVDSGFGRVVYLVLPLSEENRKILSKNNYISEDGNIMLIFGVGSKEGGNSPVYDDSNKRLSNNIVEVRKIASIFYNNFDESTLKKAITLLEESKDAMKTLETSPTTKLRRS